LEDIYEEVKKAATAGFSNADVELNEEADALHEFIMERLEKDGFAVFEFDRKHKRHLNIYWDYHYKRA
jgi:hypothetical protein